MTKLSIFQIKFEVATYHKPRFLGDFCLVDCMVSRDQILPHRIHGTSIFRQMDG